MTFIETNGIKRLEIPYYHDTMLNNGTVALYLFLKKEKQKITEVFHYDYSIELLNDKLIIESESLYEVLEEIYYIMGNEVYDTYTDNQNNKPQNIYFEFKDENLEPTKFPKMNTYGLTHMLTNNAQGGTRNEKNTRKIADIEKEDPTLAAKIKACFDENGIKILSKIYFNEKYTKITRLEKPENAYFMEGKFRCGLTGKSFKKVVTDKNISPFISSITNFNSFLSTSDKKISWLSMYLCRFAAASCLYVYENKLRERLMIYMFNDNTLTGLAELWQKNRVGKIASIDELRNVKNEFTRNFEVMPKISSSPSDLQLTNDNLFAILYTFKKRIMSSSIQKIANNPWAETDDVYPHYSIVCFRADAYSATMRPNRMDFIDNINPIIQFIDLIENPEIGIGINWKTILNDLLIIKTALETNKKASRLKREFRELILGKIFKTEPIYHEMAGFFIDCYDQTLDDKGNYRNFNNLLQLTLKYENMRNEENKELRDSAINTGLIITKTIVKQFYKEHSRYPNKEELARKAKKYLVKLRNARNFEKFRVVLTTITERYLTESDTFVMNALDEENFKEFRDFLILSIVNELVETHKYKGSQMPKDSENTNKLDTQNNIQND